MLVGIVINALTLQHVRHPAPFFAARPPAATETPAPAAARAPPRRSTPTFAAPPRAARRAADRRAVRADDAAASPRSADAIGDLLRVEADKDAQKTLLRRRTR